MRFSTIWKLLGVVVVSIALIAVYYFGSLPALYLGAERIVVLNCDMPRNKNAASVCPRLYCEKYLKENGFIDRASVVHAVSGEVFASIVQVAIQNKSTNSYNKFRYSCRIEGDRVLEVVEDD